MSLNELIRPLMVVFISRHADMLEECEVVSLGGEECEVVLERERARTRTRRKRRRERRKHHRTIMVEAMDERVKVRYFIAHINNKLLRGTVYITL